MSNNISSNTSGAPRRDDHDDEISLVDLAKILIKRWKMMAIVFLVVVFGALAYVLTMTRTYEYASIYQVAEQAPSDDSDSAVGSLEAPSSVVAKINNLYMGPVNRELRSSAGLQRLPFEVSVSNPDDTLLIRLSSEAAEADSELVEEMHEALLSRITEGQQALLERYRESLEKQLESAERALEAAQQSSSPTAGDLVVSYTNRIAIIQDRLSQLREGQVVQTAVQSLEPTGTSRSLIMALAIVLGGMLAVVAAFFTQFAVAVRDSLNEEAV
ncbi:Wzz/FepE/Etk N-terminal domain-containing protein [Halomonas kalidii]|uniref:Wzz/FepE/Etk N-terminal domain-containing protein n=1 Tax=Halomonas kalidii TaxID=3043293 RepID=A0ABT6VK45_9GAMM|nr:Wzz/FepE/Etk N-terminal domain-containing protein [Halomonas kalidii]MDI5934347.1 Wzz/FepE/Etk N-terminal domain-containing protein [Halomonas kalidii]